MEDFIDYDISSVKSVTFQGKVVLVAEAAASSGGTILVAAVYDGTAGTRPVFAALPFPKELRLGGGSLITVSQTLLPSSLAAPGSWQLACDDDCLYLFRAIGDAAHMQLFANRYLLVTRGGGSQSDPATYTLALHTETRFQKSGLKETPADKKDALSAKDANGNLFIEPVLQINLPRAILPSGAPAGTEADLLAVANGFFTALVTPSNITGKTRWLFLTAPPGSDGSRLRSVSLLRDRDGWPDLRSVESTVERDSDGRPDSRTVELIVVRDVALKDGSGQPLQLHGTPAALLFQRQEQVPKAPSNALTGPRVMLSSRATQSGGDQLACFDLALAADGTPVLPDAALSLPAQNQADVLALAFSRSDEWIEVDVDAANPNDKYAAAGYNFTIEAWVRCAAASTAQTILRRASAYPAPAPKYATELAIDAAGHLCLTAVLGDPDDLKTAPAYKIHTTAPIDLTTWRHVAATCSIDYPTGGTPTGGTIALACLVDGQAVPIVVDSGAKPTLGNQGTTVSFDLTGVSSGWAVLLGNGNLFIGGSPDDAAPGRSRSLADVRYWSVPHPQAIIAQHMAGQIDPATYQGLNGQDVLMGYWRLDGPVTSDPNSGLVTSWKSKLAGGRWVGDTPPLRALNDTSALSSAEGLSSGMGVLGFLGAVNGDPSLLSGADGRIHLYFGQATAHATDPKATSLQVAQYDTAMARTAFTLPLTGIDIKDTTATRVPMGALSLAARHAGSVYNTASAVLNASGDLVLTYAESGKPPATETFKNVPADPQALSHVINGTASGDPLKPDVRSGEVPFYDYAGRRTAIAVKTGAAPLLFIDPAPVGKTQRAMTLKTVAVALPTPDKANLTITFQLLGASATPTLTIAGLPSDAKALARALGRADYGGATATWDAAVPVMVLRAGRGQILGIGATALTVANNDNGRTRDVSAVGANGSKPSLSKVAGSPGAIVDAWNALNSAVVLVGGNADGAVAAQPALPGVPNPVPANDLQHREIDFSALFCFLAPEVDGAVAAGSYAPRAAQGYSGTAGLPTRSQPRGSVLFAATGTTVPAGAQQLLVQPGGAMLARHGNDGGWVTMPPRFVGDFSKAHAALADPSRLAAIASPDSYTLESWVRYESMAAQQDLIAAKAGPGPDLAVSLVRDISAPFINALCYSDKNWFNTKKSVTLSFRFKFERGQPLTGDTPIARIVCDGDWNTADGDSHALVLYATVAAGALAQAGHIGLRLQWSAAAEPAYASVSDSYAVDIPVGDEVFVVLSRIIDRDEKTMHGQVAIIDAAGKVLVAQKDLQQACNDQQEPNSACIVLGALSGSDGINRGFRDVKVFNSDFVSDQDAQNMAKGDYSAVTTGALNALIGDWGDITPAATDYANKNTSAAGMKLHLSGEAAPQPSLRIAGNGKCFQSAPMPLDRDWFHLAVVSPQTYAVTLAPPGGHAVADGTSIDPGQAFAVDGVIRIGTLDPADTSIKILSNFDGPNGAGFMVYLRADTKALGFIVTWEGGSGSQTFELPTTMALDPGVDTYFAVSAYIECAKQTDQGDGHFSYTASGGGGTATSDTKYDTTLHWTLALIAPGKSNVHADKVVKTDSGQTTWRFVKSSAALVVGGNKSPGAELSALRLWTVDISDSIADLAFSRDVPSALQNGLAADWRFGEGGGTTAASAVGSHALTLASANVWKTSTGMRLPTVYANGAPAAVTFRSDIKPTALADGIVLGPADSAQTQGRFSGLAEVRLWSALRSADQLVDDMYTPLSGNEEDLALYWPVSDGNGLVVSDAADDLDLALTGASAATFWKQAAAIGDAPPLGNEHPVVFNPVGTDVSSTLHVTTARSAAVCAEFGDIVADASGNLAGVQLRAYAYLVPNPKDATKTALAFAEAFKVGDADLIYMGQVQTDPAIIGYIEGAPPVPMENLTRPYYTSNTSYSTYDGITSVAFTESDACVYRYTTTGLSSDHSGVTRTAGVQVDLETKEIAAPVGLGLQLSMVKFGAQVAYDWSSDYATGKQVAGAVGIGRTDRSTTSLSLRGNWEAKPKDGAERHYVPANLGMALVKSGTADVYGLRLRRSGTLAGLVVRPEGDASIDYNLVHFPIDPAYTKQGTLDGKVGFADDADYPGADSKRGSYFKPDEAQSYAAAIGKDDDSLNTAFLGAVYQTTPDANGNLPHSTAIDMTEPEETLAYTTTPDLTALSTSIDAIAPASTVPGDRNLVNTYVWTAAGGLQVQSKSSMVSRTDTYGTIADCRWDWGVNGKIGVDPGIFFEGATLLGRQIVVTVEKARDQGQDFAIDATVDCENFLANWPYQNGKAVDEPLGDVPAPGKVDAYRFKTFYLAPDHDAYGFLFNTVIDADWLANSNSAEAVALRSVQNATKDVWRVFHRVTYVSRVPPKVNQNPSDSAVKVAPPVVNFTANGGLYHVIARDSQTNHVSIARAAAEVLDATGPLATVAPWWGALVAAANLEAPPGASMAAYQGCSRAAHAYFSAYADNPAAAV